MTTLITTSERIYVDSRVSFNYTHEVRQKWVQTPHYTYFVAGGSYEMDTPVARFMESLRADAPWPTPTVDKGTNSVAIIVITQPQPHHSCVFEHRDLKPGDVLILESNGCLEIDRLRDVDYSAHREELVRPCGSGHSLFDAFYALTKNVGAAFDFAVLADPHSGFPTYEISRRTGHIQRFDISVRPEQLGEALLDMMSVLVVPE